MPDELVACYDPATSRVVGAAPRERVRAQNLPHAATAVLLVNSRDSLFVHRRTGTKDVYPGMWDCWAGGVVTVGETPDVAAARELAEELAVVGVDLEPLTRQWYRDEHTHYLAHTYRARWDGPVTLQASEVAEGGWMTWRQLRELLVDPARPFVPDGRAALSLVSAGAMA